MSEAISGIQARIRRLFESPSDLKRAYQVVFSSEDGQKVLRHICQVGFVLRCTYVKDPMEMALNEGQRRLALSILRAACRDDEAMQELMKEMQNIQM